MKKVVVIGPESTGKSTLCDQLSQHYNTIWCREYAREYLETRGMGYEFNDLLTIAAGQVQIEENSIQQASVLINEGQAKPLLFIDTDMYVMKVWCEFVFGKCHNWILSQAALRQYDLYLLCNVDLPWTKDALREYPDIATRNKLYHYYKDIMINQHVPWINVSGNYNERLQTSINAIDQLINE